MAQKWLIEPPFGQTNNFILASMGDITGMAQNGSFYKKWLILIACWVIHQRRSVKFQQYIRYNKFQNYGEIHLYLHRHLRPSRAPNMLLANGSAHAQ